MRFDTSQNPEYLSYASRLTGTKDFGKCKTIAFYSDDQLMAVVVYNLRDESNLHLSIATSSPRWCTRSVLKVIFGFPFIQLGVNRVTADVRKTNQKSRSLVERLGFTLEGEMREYFDNGESMMIYGMTKQNCRWLK